MLKLLQKAMCAPALVRRKFSSFPCPEYRGWKERMFSAPSPHSVKVSCVLRNGLKQAVWIETGTYHGDTTQALSMAASKVYSIEPEPFLFERAQKRFDGYENVEIIKGLSEVVLPILLPTLKGDLCFWLDGHFSGGVTYRGPRETPILEELACIRENLAQMQRAVIMVDDVRCFNPNVPEYAAYPPLDYLVDWARANALSWRIEHDIFIANKS
jgi:hypothetical protein